MTAPGPPRRRLDALAGLKVLDLAEGRAARCGGLLADLGAELIKPAPGWSDDPARLRELMTAGQVVIETGPPGFLAGLGCGWPDLSRLNPGLILVSITPFGQRGPHKDRRSDELVASAVGGLLNVTGQAEGRPLRLPGPQVNNLAALYAAAGVLLALAAKRRTGRGDWLDISLQHCAAASLDHVLPRFVYQDEIAGRLGEDHWQNNFLTLPCRKGHLHLAPFQQWPTLVQWLAGQGLAPELLQPLAQSDFSDPETRRNQLPLVRRILAAWSGDRDRDELVTTGQLMGFPMAACTTWPEVKDCPQLRARNFWIPGREGREVAGLPFLIQSGPKSKSGPPPDPGPEALGRGCLAGVRIIDFTRVLAGPYATRLLADFGAEAIKIQPPSGGENNQSAYFRLYNRNKLSLSLDLNQPADKAALLDLVAESDVVIENFSPRVMDNWGLSFEHLSRVKPNLILVRMSALGQSGPRRNWVAFGPTLHALAGLSTSLSASDPAYDGPPFGPGFALADVAAGLYGALAVLAGLEHCLRTGRGMEVDLSQYEALVGLLIPQITTTEPAAPYGCYPCLGRDRWCALAVYGQTDWAALVRVLGLEELAAEPRFADPAARRAHRAELDRRLDQATATWRAEDLAEALQAAGLAAGVVQNAADLAQDPQLAGRDFLVALEDGSLTDNTPLRFQRLRSVPFRPAPELGQHNRVF